MFAEISGSTLSKRSLHFNGSGKFRKSHRALRAPALRRRFLVLELAVNFAHPQSFRDVVKACLTFHEMLFHRAAFFFRKAASDIGEELFALVRGAFLSGFLRGEIWLCFW